MKRVLVLGCPGSGKSVLAGRLHRLTGLPLIHLDQLWWRADGSHVSRAEFDEALTRVLRQPSWIIDGDYRRTWEVRVAACDTVFFLDYAPEVCCAGIHARVGQPRPDMPWVEQQADPDLLEADAQYRATRRPELLALLARYPKAAQHVFTSREAADAWLSAWTQEAGLTP